MQPNLLRTFTITLCLLLEIAFGTQWLNHRVTAASPVGVPVAFVATPLPVATVSQSYSATIESTGGVAPYSFTLQSGPLPNGIVFNNGTFSGSPTQTGTATFTIQTTDSNGCTGTQEFSLRVQSPPTIIPANALSLAQGSNGTITLATVNDVETAPGNLTVTANIVPSGLTLTNLTNSNGAITATIEAACSLSVSPKIIELSVSDGFVTVLTDVTINVTANTAPTLGTYANSSVAVFGNTTITPSAPPADNGTLANVTVAAPTFTGTITVNAAGVVSISNAGPVGNHSVTVTAKDNCNVSTPRSFTLTVNKATPVITWSNPANITYGTPLSATQLNATANVVGTFSYTPALNTVLNADNGQTLTVNFTPTDTANFTNTSKQVTLNVLKAPLTVTVNNAFRNQGVANPPLSGSITGQKNGDVITASHSTTATIASAPGNYPITATLSDPGNRLSNYQVTNTPGTLKVFNSCGISPVPFFATVGVVGGSWNYYQPLTASPPGIYIFSLFAGTLPPGLSIVNNLGQYILQGTPTQRGVFTFTLLAKNTGSTCEAVHTYTITIQ